MGFVFFVNFSILNVKTKYKTYTAFLWEKVILEKTKHVSIVTMW